MARRRRSFFFDNINKRLLVNTFKNARTSKAEIDAGTVTADDILKKSQIDSDVDASLANLVNTAPEALNTLDELAAALGDDANFATTTATSLGNRLRIDTNAQGLTATQKTNAKTNLGLATVATSGAYSDLTGTPTIPTNNNQLTNGAGYITSFDITTQTDSKYLRSDASDVYAGRVLEFGNAGNGSNTSGAFLTIEGNTDGSGEGSGRLFFREHNSTTASADKYGMSIGYRGGATSVTTAMGNSWTGLSSIGNGEWGMWGHDNSIAGSLIAHGPRSGAYTDFTGLKVGGNNVWHAGNDGSGSGLDADTLDGVQGSSYLRSDTNQTFTGDLTIDGSSAWNSGNGMLNVGGSGDARLQVRHIWGKSASSAGTDNLWLNYANTGKHVQIGNSGGGNNLYVSGALYAGGYFGGNVVWNAGNDGSGSGLDADTLDGYHSTSFRTVGGQLSAASGTWYTIAYNAGNRASARFHIRDTASSRHQSVHFYASHMYGNGNAINVVHSNVFSTSPIRYIRIKEGGTYDGALLQVYFDNTSTFRAFMYENDQSSGWVLLNTPVADGSSSGISVGNFAALTNVGAQVDVDKSVRGGFIGTGSLYMGGNITAYSDRRVKSDLQVIPDAINKVKSISGYTFDRTDQFKDDGRQTGLIAQEVLEILPEAVIGDEEGGYGLAYGNMVGLLVEAIKEQQKQIEELQEKYHDY